MAGMLDDIKARFGMASQFQGGRRQGAQWEGDIPAADPNWKPRAHRRASVRGGTPMNTTQMNPNAATVYDAAPSDGQAYAATAPDEEVGTFNGRGITRRQSDALAAQLPTQAAYVDPNAGNGTVAATGGYQAQNRSTSRGNSDEDRRRLEHALGGIGRGSPSVRRALMEAYMGKDERADTGRNALALADLEAGARSADGFATRDQAAQQFNQQLGFDREELTAKTDVANRAASSQDSIVDILAKDAKARRDDDAYALGRRGSRDAVDEERRNTLTQQYLDRDPSLTVDEARARANASVLEGRLATGELPDTEASALGAEEVTRAPLELFDDPSRRTTFDPGNWLDSAAATQVDVPEDVDVSQITTRPIEYGFGIDASTYNDFFDNAPFVGRPLDEYYAEIPTDQPGTEARAALRNLDERKAYDAQVRLARRSQAAQREQAALEAAKRAGGK